MMTEFESRITDTLQARVDRTIKTDRLRAGALARARTLRWRRRTMTGLSAAAVAALVVVAILVRPAPAPDSLASPTTLPTAVGVSGAADNPGAIGTDPAILHFDVDLGPLDAAGLTVTDTEWISTSRYERVILYGPGDTVWASIYIGPKTNNYVDDFGLTMTEVGTTWVNGRVATISSVKSNMTVWALRWRPVDEIDALVVLIDLNRSHAVNVASILRLDRAQRCAAPARLSGLPPSYSWQECQIRLRREPSRPQGVWVWSRLTLDSGPLSPTVIWLSESYQAQTEYKPNRDVDGHPAQWIDADMRGLWSLDLGPMSVFIYGRDNDRSFSEAEATWLMRHLTLSTNLTDIGTWPDRAVP